MHMESYGFVHKDLHVGTKRGVCLSKLKHHLLRERRLYDPQCPEQYLVHSRGSIHTDL